MPNMSVDLLQKRDRNAFEGGFEAGKDYANEQIAALAEQVRVLREAAAEVEWVDGGFCPRCQRHRQDGHRDLCSLAFALAATAPQPTEGDAKL